MVQAVDVEKGDEFYILDEEENILTNDMIIDGIIYLKNQSTVLAFSSHDHKILFMTSVTN